MPPCHAAHSEYGAALQTALAVLSLGPVGLADQLMGRPSKGVDVNTNVTLALSTVSAAGWLLQPSFPITPIDPCLTAQEGLSPTSGNVWATYTVVSGSVWWTVLGWSWNGVDDADGFNHATAKSVARPVAKSVAGSNDADDDDPSLASAANAPPQPLGEYSVLARHLAPMVDVTSLEGNFSAVPRGERKLSGFSVHFSCPFCAI